MNNHPNNHPIYPQAIGAPHNIQLLDNMFQIPGTEQSGVQKPTVIPAQYTYTPDMNLGGHAMNLAQGHVVTTSHELVGGQPVLIYQQGTADQQPISYKLPQMDPNHPNAQATVIVATDDQKKKDIVAVAASKIFEDDSSKKQPVPVSQSATPSANPLPTAIKSEPVAGTSGMSGPVPTPGTSGTNSSPSKAKAVIRTGGPVSVGRPRGGVRHLHRQQILPRLQLLEDEDDGLTCRMCLQSFWYKSQLIDHLRASHSISDPERYEREEREKKMRRIREQQQRQILARRQRMARGGFRGRGRGRFGMAAIATGPRPSFQYRDGAFICDLCKKSFSDGNDMVTHWKSHVKKQRLSGLSRAFIRRGRPPKAISYGSDGKGRSDKGKPRWTAYLVWSTRRRKELAEEEPDMSFSEVAKAISVEWKQVSEEDREKYQDEADEMNATGQRKLPKEREYNSSEGWTSEDPDYEEVDENVKPIMLKIKKEGEEGDEAHRSQRQRKRPSFFQEFENEENNLDKILDEFEQEQMEEAKKPREKKVVERPADYVPKKRRRRERTPEEEDEPVELEQTRSGRVRKKRKIMTFNDPDLEEDDTDEGEDSEDKEDYQPDSEPDEPPEEFIDEDPEDEDDSDDYEDEYDEDGLLPLKKRSRKNLMTDEEIEEATRRAMITGVYDEDDDDSSSESDTDSLEYADDDELDPDEPKKPRKKRQKKSKKSGDASKEGTSKEGNASKVDGDGKEAGAEKSAEDDESQDGVDESSQGSTAEATVTSEDVPSATEPEPASSEPQADASSSKATEIGDVDDLMTSATSQMEEGDDKFKDIIAEGQMDQIFQ